MGVPLDWTILGINIFDFCSGNSYVYDPKTGTYLKSKEGVRTAFFTDYSYFISRLLKDLQAYDFCFPLDNRLILSEDSPKASLASDTLLFRELILRRVQEVCSSPLVRFAVKTALHQRSLGVASIKSDSLS